MPLFITWKNISLIVTLKEFLNLSFSLCFLFQHKASSQINYSVMEEVADLIGLRPSLALLIKQSLTLSLFLLQIFLAQTDLVWIFFHVSPFL